MLDINVNPNLFGALINVLGEVEYAKAKWENHPDRAKQDADKSIEFWILHIQNYLDSASKKCYNVDKTEALADLRKAAGLLLRCFENLGVPPREIDQDTLNDLLANRSISWDEYVELTTACKPSRGKLTPTDLAKE